MTRHFKMPFNWKFSPEFTFDMSYADRLLKMGWSIKRHEEPVQKDQRDKTVS